MAYEPMEVILENYKRVVDNAFELNREDFLKSVKNGGACAIVAALHVSRYDPEIVAAALETEDLDAIEDFVEEISYLTDEEDVVSNEIIHCKKWGWLIGRLMDDPHSAAQQFLSHEAR